MADRASLERSWLALDIGPLWRRRDMPAREQAMPNAPITVADAFEPIPADACAPASVGRDAPAVASMNWEQLADAVSGCRACGLCESRTQTVFGVGARDGGWMIVGEAPGQEEDQRGEPFVGQAGRLLDAMLISVGLARSRNVYIANVLKCRPPRNRDPQPEEVERCSPFLRRQIELIDPRLIIVMGRFAAQTLLQTGASIGSLRGRVHHYALAQRDVPVVVTYHPAYLLRSLAEKSKSWADLCLAKQVFEQTGAPIQ